MINVVLIKLAKRDGNDNLKRLKFTLINSHMKLYLYNNIFIDIKSSPSSDNISCANYFPNVHFVMKTQFEHTFLDTPAGLTPS